MLTSKSKLRPLYFASKQVLAAGILLCAAASGVHASSHREAPLIATMPKVDGTDFYMFNSYEPNRHGYVTLIANYSPLEDAYGGPNYYSLDPTALYEIHIDNVGDGKEHLTFQFRFKNTLSNIALNVGGIVGAMIVLVGDFGGEVPACREADEADLRRIDAPLRRPRADQTDGALPVHQGQLRVGIVHG